MSAMIRNSGHGARPRHSARDVMSNYLAEGDVAHPRQDKLAALPATSRALGVVS